ncbi:MAG: hypothetical protein GY697_07025 [Desulfobacterales bacterium]|nr:hypothetical protein [Desulfobacterales bacterium]
MKPSATATETFSEFRKSFFYGSRSDLNFKFIEHLTDEQADEFLQGLLRKITGAYDKGNTDQIFAHVLKWQTTGYQEQKNFDYSEGPFVKLPQPVKDTTVALITSSGHFVTGNDPRPFGLKAMTQKDAEKRIFDFLKEAPVLSEIPRQTPLENLEVRHGGYDVCSSQADTNATFPIEILAALEREGKIGRLAANAYSFVGACSQMRLLKKNAPEWAAKLLAADVEAAVLVPV